MIPQVDLFSFVFWKNLKTPKRHFKNNRPLNSYNYFVAISFGLNYSLTNSAKISCSNKVTLWKKRQKAEETASFLEDRKS